MAGVAPPPGSRPVRSARPAPGTVVSVGALIRREGHPERPTVRPLEAGPGGRRVGRRLRWLSTFAGVLAAGSLVGALLTPDQAKRSAVDTGALERGVTPDVPVSGAAPESPGARVPSGTGEPMSLAALGGQPSSASATGGTRPSARARRAAGPGDVASGVGGAGGVGTAVDQAGKVVADNPRRGSAGLGGTVRDSGRTVGDAVGSVGAALPEQLREPMNGLGATLDEPAAGQGGVGGEDDGVGELVGGLLGASR